VSRPHKPILGHWLTPADLAPSPTGEQSVVGPMDRAELAAATAAVVLAAGRAVGQDGQPADPAKLVSLADTVGLETLAELWRDAEPDSLAGALWALYVLRTWCRTRGEDVLRLWSAGRPYAPADEVVAGVGDRVDGSDPSAIEALADAVLSGAYGGRFDVALERAAAFFRVVSAGRRELLDSMPGGTEPAEVLAQRNDRVAEGLSRAAQRWRAGVLA
jgi:hypothetical protein